MTSREPLSLSLIFPLAGQDDVDEFRALRVADGQSLIHRALRSFAPFANGIAAVHGIVLKTQEQQFAVSRRLKNEMGGFAFKPTILDAPTLGPAETVAKGAIQTGLTGPALICDLDHRLNVAPLFAAIDDASDACLACLWPLAGEDLKRWSVAAVGGNGAISAVADKRLPAGPGFFHGVIGCYYVPDIADTARMCASGGFKRFSQYFNALAAKGQHARGVHLEEAEFFGDEERIRTLEADAPRGTIFCDIDGTLIRHEDRPSYSRLPELLPGSREKLASWIAEGYKIVLCTARLKEDEAKLAAVLQALELPYHHLLCGLSSGTRILINDRKPQAIFAAQASSLEIVRDAGIAALELKPASQPNILRRFEGGSFAETLLLEEGGRRFVRKRIAKQAPMRENYNRLRDQFRTLERFALMDSDMVPVLLGEESNSHEYFYDMEYLADHTPLADCPAHARTSAMETLFDRLDTYLYSHRNRDTDLARSWLLRHLEAKIDPKIEALRAYPMLEPFLNGEGVVIDGAFHLPLKQVMSKVRQIDTLTTFVPQFLSFVHGDLTFQNVMLGPDGDVKLIDMEAQDGLEAPELDLGKMFQSIFSQYERWSRIDTPLCQPVEDGVRLLFSPTPPDPNMCETVARRWSSILGCSEQSVALKGQFYLGLHLVRMVPFRLKQSVDQAAYALASALVYLNRVLASAECSGAVGTRQVA